MGGVLLTSVDSAPWLQVLHHEFFWRRKFTEFDLGHVVVLTHCADHFWIFLLTVFSLNMDPRDFPTRSRTNKKNLCVGTSEINNFFGYLFFFFLKYNQIP